MMSRVLCCLAVLTCAACGDDDGGGTTVTTGLPRTDELSSLDDEDAEQVCRNTVRSFNMVLSDSELERISCIVLALDTVIEESGGDVGSAEIAECNELTQDCLNGELVGGELDIRIDSEETCEGAMPSEEFAECDATVGDYEDCAGAFKAQLRRKLTSVSCDGLRDLEKLTETLEEQIDESKEPQCKALQDRCPDLSFNG